MTDFKGEIIVADDEMLILMEFEAALIEANFNTHIATDAKEARAIFAQRREQGLKTDLIISDNTMLGELGSSMLIDLSSQFKDTKYLLVSGTRPDDWAKTGIPFLDKPIKPAQLIQKVKAILGHS